MRRMKMNAIVGAVEIMDMVKPRRTWQIQIRIRVMPRPLDSMKKEYLNGGFDDMPITIDSSYDSTNLHRTFT